MDMNFLCKGTVTVNAVEGGANKDLPVLSPTWDQQTPARFRNIGPDDVYFGFDKMPIVGSSPSMGAGAVESFSIPAGTKKIYGITKTGKTADLEVTIGQGG